MLRQCHGIINVILSCMSKLNKLSVCSSSHAADSMPTPPAVYREKEREQGKRGEESKENKGGGFAGRAASEEEKKTREKGGGKGTRKKRGIERGSRHRLREEGEEEGSRSTPEQNRKAKEKYK